MLGRGGVLECRALANWFETPPSVLKGSIQYRYIGSSPKQIRNHRSVLQLPKKRTRQPAHPSTAFTPPLAQNVTSTPHGRCVRCPFATATVTTATTTVATTNNQHQTMDETKQPTNNERHTTQQIAKSSNTLRARNDTQHTRTNKPERTTKVRIQEKESKTRGTRTGTEKEDT